MRARNAPIAMFAHKRPEHLRAALESLRENPEAKESELYVFCDGPRREGDRPLTDAVRAVAKEKPWCGAVHVMERAGNLGLRRSVTEGVSELCAKFGEVIVLEDDLLLSPHFLSFMNEALERYRADDRVMQVTAYNYPVASRAGRDAFFLLHSSCWGWGTWERAWKKLDHKPTLLGELRKRPELRRRFDMDDAYPYTELLELQAEGKVDSWGVLWYQALFTNQGLTLMPERTLVRNLGSDGSGTHGFGIGYSDTLSSFRVSRFPERVENDAEAWATISAYLKHERHSLWKKAQRRVQAVKQRLLRFFSLENAAKRAR